MPYTVEIRRNRDGLVRKYEENFDWHGDYIWADGNFSCDCNRALFFARAVGEPDPECYHCGDHAYSVRITSGGVVLYQEFELEKCQ